MQVCLQPQQRSKVPDVSLPGLARPLDITVKGAFRGQARPPIPLFWPLSYLDLGNSSGYPFGESFMV